MKFLHMADMHFDIPFTSLASKGNLGELRRLEQRSALKKIINYINENNIEYLFIAGDLIEYYNIRKSTIEFINNEFKKIPETNIFIVPGNHDPYIRGSYYEMFDFNENVHILKKDFDIYEDANIKIYGCGFTSFYMNENPILNNKIEKSNRPTILIMHADVDGVKDENGFSYNPILGSKLKELDVDYIALGHIHNINFKENQKINYAGSTISLGFDELGEHGVIVGEFEKGKLKTEFLKIDEKQYTEYEINVDNLFSNEEIIEKINETKFDEDKYIKIILTGKSSFNIEENKILKLVDKDNILKIKNKTKINIDIEKISNENTLKGMFVKEVMKKYKTGEISEEELNEILEIGFSAM